MSFNPLGSFDPKGPIAPHLVDGAREYFSRLPVLAEGTAIYHIYGHWTVGHYNQDFADYNGAVRYDGTNFHLDIPHDPRANVAGSPDPAAHTWLRNAGGFGISTDDMAFASTHDFGPEPVTVSALWWLCAGVAAAAARYDIDLSGAAGGTDRYAGEPSFLTHAEAAVRGGNPAHPVWYNYGPSGTCERWDLATFVPLPSGLSVTDEMATACGNALRTFSHRIKLAAFS